MAWIIGMHVKIITAGGRASGTNDHVYVGLNCGRYGGIEIPLWSKKINDFEPGTVNYILGEIPDRLRNQPSTVTPFVAERHDNYMRECSLDFEKLHSVYIRKNAAQGHDNDDAWLVRKLEITFIEWGAQRGPDQEYVFEFSSSHSPELNKFFGNEYGQLVYLRQKNL